MALLGSLRLGLVAVLCATALGLAAPASAASFEDCFDDQGSQVSDSSDCFVDGELDEGTSSTVPGGFVALFVLVVLGGIGVTIWKVTTARELARQSGMDPDLATGMTLLDDNGLSATYLASSLRTSRPYEDPNLERRTPPATPKGTPAERLEELKRLLDAGLITLVEYDARRKAIVDSL